MERCGGPGGVTAAACGLVWGAVRITEVLIKADAAHSHEAAMKHMRAGGDEKEMHEIGDMGQQVRGQSG